MQYRHVEADGIAAVVVNRRRLLLMKRRYLPFLKNAGAWSFVFGHRENGERYLETAYREIREEAGIGRERLELLGDGFPVGLFDPKRGIRWSNMMFIFRSDTGEVRKDFENAAYRWAGMSELANHERYTNLFIDEERILKRISRYVNGK